VSDFETISLVTATYNSSRYLEATLQSVLQQNYPALEYFVIDGASNDGTQAIIERYADRLTHWESAPDGGMYDAIQKGFTHSTGTIMGYLNSDDLHLPHTLRTVNTIFRDLPQVEWISSLRPMIWNEAGQPVDVMALNGYHKSAFMQGEYLYGGHYMRESIQQESTFWRRSLWEKAGGSLDTSLKLAGDLDLWARFYQHADLVGVRTILAGFRIHSEQLTSKQRQAYDSEAIAVFQRHGGHFQGRLGAALRKHISPIVPRRLKQVAGLLGINYRATNAVYNLKEGRWVLRYDYI
jgi:glycosyltransferase involved in cell wall biosynthesis